MNYCTRCGHELGVGRFCTNCGHPIATPTDTAERVAIRDPASSRSGDRAAAPPVVPPTAQEAPPAQRFPMYADEGAADQDAPESVVPGLDPLHPQHDPDGRALRERLGVVPDAPIARPGAHAASGPAKRRFRAGIGLPIVAAAVVIVLVGGAGAWLLTRGDADPSAADPLGTSSTSPSRSSDQSPSTAPGSPGSPGAATSPGGSNGGLSVDVARFASAMVPATAEPNQDVDGDIVRYEARNMLDGVAATCWRMPGDGTGDTISFTLAEPTTVTQVGLINGYAKTAHENGVRLDWYHGNRRILAAQWSFDDGTVIEQTFDDTRRMQTVAVPEVTTQAVRLTLLEVSGVGTGPAARDNTAISDVTLQGRTG